MIFVKPIAFNIIRIGANYIEISPNIDMRFLAIASSDFSHNYYSYYFSKNTFGKP